jgi:hypothetical protein
VVERHGVEQVIVTFSRAPNDVLLRLVRRCEELGVSVSFVPRLFEKVNGRVTVEHLGGLPLVSALPLADQVEWDNYYIENWSLWLDLKIALMTALAVVRSSPQVE